MIYYGHNAGFPYTAPETERVLFALLREMPLWRKLSQVGRELAVVGLRERHAGYFGGNCRLD